MGVLARCLRGMKEGVRDLSPSPSLRKENSRFTRLAGRRRRYCRAYGRVKCQRTMPRSYRSRGLQRSGRTEGRSRRLPNRKGRCHFTYRTCTLRGIKDRRLRAGGQRRRCHGARSHSQGLYRFHVQYGSTRRRIQRRRASRGTRDNRYHNVSCHRSRRLIRPSMRLHPGIVSNGELRSLVRPRRGRRCGRGRAIRSTRDPSDRITTVLLRPLVSGSGSRTNYRIRRREERTSDGQVRCGLAFRARCPPIRVRRLILVTRGLRLPHRESSLHRGNDSNDTACTPTRAVSGRQIRCNVSGRHNCNNVRHLLQVP